MKLKTATSIKPVTGTPLPSSQTRIVRPVSPRTAALRGAPDSSARAAIGRSANSLSR
ncbi:Uncharacterised protein [Mycobacteroides abscessus subsp. abscessus]|nr:Uncharacterised protein [Mycobacteroides abscessus subsp. abscessus]